MNDKTKWTPWPWERVNLTIRDVRSRCVIARVCDAPESDAVSSPEQATANANLITAAPQMAEALDALVKTAINADDDPIGYRGALRASIEQAIAALRAAGVE